MKFVLTTFLALLIVSAVPETSQACGGHKARCHGHHHRPIATMTQPAFAYAPVAAPVTYASPQVAQASMPVPATPALTATPAPAVVEVQPTYEYAASTTGQPAYYYTYDSSGKLVVAQWMDWIFRGGRAAGEPVPPLPIIGALRNR